MSMKLMHVARLERIMMLYSRLACMHPYVTCTVLFECVLTRPTDSRSYGVGAPLETTVVLLATVLHAYAWDMPASRAKQHSTIGDGHLEILPEAGHCMPRNCQADWLARYC